MSRRNHAFPIAGVGASVGGVEALEGFFKGIPPDPVIAFVVITHLSPKRESQLPEIIENKSAQGRVMINSQSNFVANIDVVQGAVTNPYLHSCMIKLKDQSKQKNIVYSFL